MYLWTCETKTSVQSQLEVMGQYLQKQMDEKFITDTMFSKLEEFIDEVTVYIPKLSLAYSSDPNMMLCCRTSGRGEAEHRTLKNVSVSTIISPI